MGLFPPQTDLLDHFDGERFSSALSAGLRSRDVEMLIRDSFLPFPACGLTQLEVRRLDVRQARVRFSARHPMEVLLLVSKEAMKIQEDRP